MSSNPAPNQPGHESLRHLQPAAMLLERIKAELAAEFDSSKPIRLSRAPGTLDVMGGIAAYTGSLVIGATLDCAAAVAVQRRKDRLVQIFSFNLYDQHLPFTFGIPLDSLARFPVEKLREEFAEPGRRWAAHVAGPLHVLHESKLIDLLNPEHRGLNIAVLNSVPNGAGVGSSAAIEVATMINLLDHFGIRKDVDAMRAAVLSQRVQDEVAGCSGKISGQIVSCIGQSEILVRVLCQPHEMKNPLSLPQNTRIFGINSNVTRNVSMYGRTRCAAFMGHRIILGKMQEIGQAMGRPLWGDPMHGYLANLDPEDYKKIFRSSLPENMSGQQFLDKFGTTIDTATQVSPIEWYQVLHAVDHHVLEARRVKQFAEFLEEAATLHGAARKKALDKAGHLMYASHLSYTNDAMLGCDECDLLAQLVRECEGAGLYGARITAGGGGGTVAVLAECSDKADSAMREIMKIYQDRTGRKCELVMGGSHGAWHLGTVEV